MRQTSINNSYLPQIVRNADRFREVVTILAKHGLADWLSTSGPVWLADWVRLGRNGASSGDKDSPDSRLTTSQRIRVAMTELGTTTVKFGQILSTRPDLVGDELADELAQLRCHTPPDPPDVVQAIIETELDGKLEDLFASFETQPIASASIGQVHRARLLSGEQVVVKVQHAGIENRIVNDLEILMRLAQLAESHSAVLRQYRPIQVVEGFRRTMMRELDFARERSNAELFRKNFHDNPGVQFPSPQPELCSRRVLTMEYFEGIEVSDQATLQASGLDLSEVARRGANVFLDMIFRDGFYHADPHPGNLLVMPETVEVPETDASENSYVIGVLDSGMVGRVDEALREDLERMLIAAARQDAEEIGEIVVRWGEVPAEFDELSLLESIREFLADYMGQSLDEFDISGCLRGIMVVIREHHIILPAKVAMLLKVLMMLEGTSRQLNPKFSLAELIEPYAKQAARRRLSPRRMARRLMATYKDWDRLLQLLPRDVADILHNFRKGKFDVHLEHRNLETVVNRLVMGILTAALFVGSASLWSNQVPPVLYGASVPGLVGCAVATVMGWNLIREIRRR